jgi:hypothetical protein
VSAPSMSGDNGMLFRCQVFFAMRRVPIGVVAY